MRGEATAPAGIRISRRGDSAPVVCSPGTTAGDALARLDAKQARKAVAARVDGKVVDLAFPLERDAEVEAILPDSEDGLDVLRHSTAHLLAHAVQELFPGTQV